MRNESLAGRLEFNERRAKKRGGGGCSAVEGRLSFRLSDRPISKRGGRNSAFGYHLYST